MERNKSTVDHLNPPPEKDDLEPDICFHFNIISCLHPIALPVDGKGDFIPASDMSDVIQIHRPAKLITYQWRNIPTCMPHVTQYHLSLTLPLSLDSGRLGTCAQRWSDSLFGKQRVRCSGLPRNFGFLAIASLSLLKSESAVRMMKVLMGSHYREVLI